MLESEFNNSRSQSKKECFKVYFGFWNKNNCFPNNQIISNGHLLYKDDQGSAFWFIFFNIGREILVLGLPLFFLGFWIINHY